MFAAHSRFDREGMTLHRGFFVLTHGLFARLIAPLVCLLLFAISSAAIEREVWISPQGIGPGNVAVTNVNTSDTVYGGLVRYPSNIVGTPTYPFRCPDPSSLGWVIGSVLTNTNMTVHLMTGTFLVPGSGLSTLSGWKLRGEGMDATLLRFAPGPALIGGVSIIGTTPSSAGPEVSDLTVDCNMQNVFTSGAVGAVSAGGSQAKITRVKVINWGSSNSTECFPLTTGPWLPSWATNTVIEDCIVTQPSLAAFNGASAVDTEPASVRCGIIRNLFINNIQSGSTGQIAGFHGLTAYNIMRKNYFYDVTGPGGASIYADSWSPRDILIDRNVMDNVSGAVRYQINGTITNLLITDNVVRCANGYAIEYLVPNAETGTVTNLLVERNIAYPTADATNAVPFALGFFVTGKSQINGSVLQNIFQGTGGMDGFDFFAPAFVVPTWAQPTYPYVLNLGTWDENFNLSGTEIYTGTSAYWQPGKEDSIIFTPTANGWYRLINGSGYGDFDGSGASSGTITIESDLSSGTNVTDAEFTIAINGFANSTNNLGRITVVRTAAWNPQVIEARIGADNLADGLTFVDINVTNVTAQTRFIKVTSKGHFRGTLLNPPQLVGRPPALTISAGL